MPAASATMDGRTARRERGRRAVTEAMIDLVLEGHLPPAAEDVAARAGVSQASLFRYFDTLDELRQATIARYFERFAGLFDIPSNGEGPLAERIDRYVAARMRLYATTAPMARLARSRAAEVADVDDSLRRQRAWLTEQLRRHFAPELARLTPARRDDTVALVTVATSFESWTQLAEQHARSTAQIRRAWRRQLRLLLADPG